MSKSNKMNFYSVAVVLDFLLTIRSDSRNKRKARKTEVKAI